MNNARERIEGVVLDVLSMGYGDGVSGEWDSDTSEATDRIITIVREALLSEEAATAFDRATGFEVPVTYSASMKIRDILDGIDNALSAAFGGDTDGGWDE